MAGAAIGGGIQNISTNGTKFIQNSVVGAIGSIVNGLGNGQNIFKSALIKFTEINYSFDISGNSKTATDYFSIHESEVIDEISDKALTQNEVKEAFRQWKDNSEAAIIYMNMDKGIHLLYYSKEPHFLYLRRGKQK